MVAPATREGERDQARSHEDEEERGLRGEERGEHLHREPEREEQGEPEDRELARTDAGERGDARRGTGGRFELGPFEDLCSHGVSVGRLRRLL